VADNAGSGGTERDANSNLFSTPGRPCEHQSRHVRASDEQDQAHYCGEGGRKSRKRGPYQWMDAALGFRQGDQTDIPMRSGVRVLQVSAHDVERGTRLIDRDVRLQPSRYEVIATSLWPAPMFFTPKA